MNLKDFKEEYSKLEHFKEITVTEFDNSRGLAKWEGLLEKIRNRGIIPKNSKYDIIVAFSGGSDSVVALYLTIKKYHLNPLVLNVSLGTQGFTTFKNIINITNFLKVDLLMINKKGIIDYPSLLNKGIEPCLRCNKLRYQTFKEISTFYNIPIIITGGDIPLDGKLIIKRDNIYYPRIIGLNKLNNEEVRNILKKMPWKNPSYSFSSTDCIICDAILIKFRELYNCYPSSLWNWYYDRVHLGYLSKSKAIKELEFMVEKGIFLPDKVCEELLEKFGLDFRNSPYRKSYFK